MNEIIGTINHPFEEISSVDSILSNSLEQKILPIIKGIVVKKYFYEYLGEF